MAAEARLEALKAEVLAAQQVAEEQGKENDRLRHQLGEKQARHNELASKERLAQSRLSTLAVESEDLKELVAGLRDELDAKEFELRSEKEALQQSREQAAQWQRQLGEVRTRLAAAEAAEKTAAERASAAESARALAEADAERARRDAAAQRSESRVAMVQETGMAGGLQATELAAQLRDELQGAQALVRDQAVKLATLAESEHAKSFEIDSLEKRLLALGKLLEEAQSDNSAKESQLGKATHEVWEGALQQQMWNEETKAAKVRLEILQKELEAKNERLREAEQELSVLRASVSQQQVTVASAERALEKMRKAELDHAHELRQMQSRAEQAEATKASLEAQLAQLKASLAEARQASVDKEQAVAHARSQQLAAELRAADAEQRRDTEGRRAAVAEAEVHVAVDRYARLKDVCSDLRARLEQRESALADAYGADETRRNVSEPLAMQQLEEAKDQAKALEQSLAGRDERHKMLLDTLTALRRVLAERENRVRELTEHVARLESVEIPILKEEKEAAREQAAAANKSIQGAELRLSELRQRFDEAQAHVSQLTTTLTEALEAKNTAEEHAAQQATLAAARQREAIEVAEQRRGEAARAEELFAELRGLRDGHHNLKQLYSQAQAELDASAERREAAEDAAELERQRARANAFDLEMMRDALADERSKHRLKEAELLARDEQIRTLNELLEAARAKVRARSDRADELHAHLRQAALEGEARATELAAAHGRISSLEVAVTAKDEQLEHVRSKLKAAAMGKLRHAGGAEASLGASVEALSDELRAKDEQVALLRQSIAVLEEEMLAKEGRAGATDEKHALLQRECAARDEQIMVLAEKLQAAQLEIKIGGSQLGRKNEELAMELQTTKAALMQAQRLAGIDPVAEALTSTKGLVPDGVSLDSQVKGRFFHNTCLLVKVLLAAQTKVKLNNLPIEELYRDVIAKALPVDAWPQYVYERFTG